MWPFPKDDMNYGRVYYNELMGLTTRITFPSLSEKGSEAHLGDLMM